MSPWALAALRCVTVGTLGLAGLLLSGCGGDGARSPIQRPGEPTTPETRPWGRAEAVDGGHSLRILYLTGPSFELERVRIAEGEHRVVVTLLERPPQGASTALGKLACVDLELRRPLAGRAVVDGASARRGERRLPPGTPAECEQPTKVERVSTDHIDRGTPPRRP